MRMAVNGCEKRLERVCLIIVKACDRDILGDPKAFFYDHSDRHMALMSFTQTTAWGGSIISCSNALRTAEDINGNGDGVVISWVPGQVRDRHRIAVSVKAVTKAFAVHMKGFK